jgi:hypothetical protein
LGTSAAFPFELSAEELDSDTPPTLTDVERRLIEEESKDDAALAGLVDMTDSLREGMEDTMSDYRDASTRLHTAAENLTSLMRDFPSDTEQQVPTQDQQQKSLQPGSKPTKQGKKKKA